MKKLLMLVMAVVMLGFAGAAQATIINFTSSNTTFGGGQINTSAPTFGDNVAANGTGVSISNGATPNVVLDWLFNGTTAGAPWSFNNYAPGPGWPDEAIYIPAYANTVGGAPSTEHHDIVFTPQTGFRVLVNSFVYDAYNNTRQDLFDWELRKDNTSGAIIGSGTVVNAVNGGEVTVSTGMASAYAGPVVLRLTVDGSVPFGTYNSNYNVGIDDISFTQQADVAVPEPASLSLIALGLLGLGFVALRKKYRRA